ncbi:uncharacterized protein TNCT_17971 [Trichonephila clavata]|uniref:Uncharacterized protein n=1 Tax=Trichonephila clavata TaxID=2740835 RepID=A0A8X6HAN1_TRICU|nr:uncharacterized protein TNCT_17971 [Trichonephila clavata]
MEGIKATFGGKDAFLDVSASKLIIKAENKETCVLIKDVQSLHTKNEPTFLLKIKHVSGSIILEFETHNTRDLAKNILLHSIKQEPEILRNILENNQSAKSVLSNTKNIVSSDIFWGANKDKIQEMQNMMLQLPLRELNYDTDKFIYSLPPILLKIYSSMNCTINQFYNYILQSNFYDIRNKTNSIDRLIQEELRDYKIENNYATRINNYSFMSLYKKEDRLNVNYNKPEKKIEFEPIYYIEEAKDDRLLRDYELHNRSLRCDIPLDVEEKEEDIYFDKKDVRKLIDLSKILYLYKKSTSDHKENEYNETVAKINVFLDQIKKKYGEKKMVYLKRIIPSFFIKE